MTDRPDAARTLREQQFALARHVRDPSAHPPPSGIEERRLKIYRDLFRNSIEGLLAGNFPVIRRTLADEAWQSLVRRFYADHRCRTPLFTRIAREFVDYLEQRSETDATLPPWLAELAHYEWIELALQIADETMPDTQDAPSELLDGVPLVSPLARVLSYRWPVQRIGPDYRPAEAPDTPTLLLARRDASGEVRFSELSPLTWRLLDLVGDLSGRSGRQLLEQLAGEAEADDIEAFVGEGRAMLQRLRNEGVLVATGSARLAQ